MEARNREDQTEHFYTIDEYYEITGDERTELIDGRIVMMAAPSWSHQEASDGIYVQLHSYLRGKSCVARSAVGVQFRENERRPTQFVPDITVVCDRSKIGKHGIVGVPDMIVEVLSPSNRGRDRVTKFNRYLREGVREYWIVDPDDRSVSVHILDNGRYVATAYGADEIVPVSILEGCAVDMALVFPQDIDTQDQEETYDQDE